MRIGRLESELPIILGGMSARLTGAELAAAVANEGGFGTIAGAGMGLSETTRGQSEYFKASQEILAEEIHKAREISNDGNIGVNLMVAATDYEGLVEVAVRSEAKYIASGAGLPLSLPDYVKKYAVPGRPTPELMPIVSSVRAAALVLRRWRKSGATPAAFIVETPNTAGGHLGVSKADQIGKEELALNRVVPALVALLDSLGLDIPVIAAGGIWDGTDIRETLSARIGARGVQMSTRFLISDECDASREFKDRHATNSDPIVVVMSPVGMPGRAIANDFVRRVYDNEAIVLGPCVNCLKVCAHRDGGRTSYCILRALHNVRMGAVENGVLFSGTNGDRLKHDRANGIHSVQQIMRELVG